MVASEKTHDRAWGRCARVLVVGADHHTADSARQALVRATFAVEVVASADEAILWIDKQSLPERERTIVQLRFFEDMTQAQIAARVGVSQMQISRSLTRSLSQLRTRLHPAGT